MERINLIRELEIINSKKDMKISGKATKMQYYRNGMFKCPKCNYELDLSEDTFKLRGEIS
jgi:hypothetical protein